MKVNWAKMSCCCIFFTALCRNRVDLQLSVLLSSERLFLLEFLHVKQNNVHCSGGSTEICSTEMAGRKCQWQTVPSLLEAAAGLRSEPESQPPVM